MRIRRLQVMPLFTFFLSNCRNPSNTRDARWAICDCCQPLTRNAKLSSLPSNAPSSTSIALRCALTGLRDAKKERANAVKATTIGPVFWGSRMARKWSCVVLSWDAKPFSFADFYT